MCWVNNRVGVIKEEVMGGYQGHGRKRVVTRPLSLLALPVSLSECLLVSLVGLPACPACFAYLIASRSVTFCPVLSGTARLDPHLLRRPMNVSTSLNVLMLLISTLQCDMLL